MRLLAGAKKLRLPTPKRVAFVIIAATAVAMLAIPVSATSARLVWNATLSAPLGLYSIEQGSWHVGDRVAVLPSELLAADLAHRGVLPPGKLLIKRIAAGQGDIVCRDGVDVTVNGSVVAVARVVSGSGEKLPAWLGCRNLGSSDVFLLGDTADSYDGRYFGVTSASEVARPRQTCC
jgi:type IV secretory pathway protease TraF